MMTKATLMLKMYDIFRRHSVKTQNKIELFHSDIVGSSDTSV